jgi:hypothetical protein
MSRRRPGLGLATRLGDARLANGFFKGLGSYLKHPLDAAEGRRRLDRQLAAREHSFIAVLEYAVFENRDSPYRRLFDWAGIELGDVIAGVRDRGLEATLRQLYEAGVHVTLEEFKGRARLRRPGLELELGPHDFDNPLAATHYEARTGGSNGPSRRILVDLSLLEHESAYHALFLGAAEVAQRPLGIWHPAPPGAVGIKMALIQAKLGRPVERWFSQNRLTVRSGGARYPLFTRGVVGRARLRGLHIPVPEHTPASEGGRVAEWLAAMRAAGSPGVLVTSASNGVRVCLAAIDRGLDISGTFFVLGGEPYTPAKAKVVVSTGSRAACHYAMAEAGAIGIACTGAGAADDVHLLSDKVASIDRERSVGGNGTTVRALFHTTLLLSSPKLMLNVESGDSAVRERHACGCRALPAAFDTHLHTIRSYEKLTSEGMSFLGGDLITLLEEVLPGRFGGHPTDYQLVESERGGLPKVNLLVRPTVGSVDSDEVARSALEFLRSRGDAERMMGEIWDQGETVQVIRGDPHMTEASKILPLQTLGG